MSKYLDGQCYPGAVVGTNQKPKELVNVGLTHASGGYPSSSGRASMSMEQMLPKGEIPALKIGSTKKK